MLVDWIVSATDFRLRFVCSILVTVISSSPLENEHWLRLLLRNNDIVESFNKVKRMVERSDSFGNLLKPKEIQPKDDMKKHPTLPPSKYKLFPPWSQLPWHSSRQDSQDSPAICTFEHVKGWVGMHRLHRVESRGQEGRCALT